MRIDVAVAMVVTGLFMPGLGLAGCVVLVAFGEFGLNSRGVTPLVSSTTVALVALASTSRDRKPSKCSPLTSTTSAFAMATASSGLGS